MPLVQVKNILPYSHNKWDKHLISSKKDLSRVPLFVSHNGIQKSVISKKTFLWFVRLQNQQSKSIRSWRKCMASFLQIQRMMKIFNTHNRSGRLGGLMFSFKRVQKSLFSNGLALYWPYWLVSCWPLHQIMLIVFWFHLVQDVEKVTLVWQEEDVGFLSGKPSQLCSQRRHFLKNLSVYIFWVFWLEWSANLG